MALMTIEEIEAFAIRNKVSTLTTEDFTHAQDCMRARIIPDITYLLDVLKSYVKRKQT